MTPAKGQSGFFILFVVVVVDREEPDIWSVRSQKLVTPMQSR